MTDNSLHDFRALLARARAALETPADLDSQAMAFLVEDIALAEQGLAHSPMLWPLDIHVGVIEHKEGANIHVSLDRPALEGQIAEFCREWWSDIRDPRKAANLSDTEVIETYFDRHDSECLTIEQIRIEPPPAAPARSVQPALEHGRYCVLSTAHLSAATAELLDLWSSWPPGDRPLDIAAAVHGWFVPTRLRDESGAAPLPEDLAALITFGRERGFAYVLVDCDGDMVDDLPLCNW
ncbi:DUF5983 family protein [Novosphingobium sp. KACC 22771]|uniref:DUF5983 family protein n=1 Tax=Novosphingobium sp. KACC 22771 TaxID=3025670 RepID=UPI0023663234|nr:hypothetical protein [Novosphingobium sp. KACC 22771]WDF75250.1 hypothetical protein PQ467_19740 [Novosphingobium sp. KACC 22771]